MSVTNAAKTPFERTIEGWDDRKLFEEERLILVVTGALLEAVRECEVTQADLARRLKVSRSAVSQLLDGSRNMTLRTLADLALALGQRVEVELEALNGVVYRELDDELSEPIRVRQPSQVMIKVGDGDTAHRPPTADAALAEGGIATNGEYAMAA